MAHGHRENWAWGGKRTERGGKKNYSANSVRQENLCFRRDNNGEKMKDKFINNVYSLGYILQDITSGKRGATRLLRTITIGRRRNTQDISRHECSDSHI